MTLLWLCRRSCPVKCRCSRASKCRCCKRRRQCPTYFRYFMHNLPSIYVCVLTRRTARRFVAHKLSTAVCAESALSSFAPQTECLCRQRRCRNRSSSSPRTARLAATAARVSAQAQAPSRRVAAADTAVHRHAFDQIDFCRSIVGE